MTAKMFGNVQLSADPPEKRLTADDKVSLAAILELKLHDMFPEQRSRMPALGYILDGDFNKNEPHPQ